MSCDRSAGPYSLTGRWFITARAKLLRNTRDEVWLENDGFAHDKILEKFRKRL
jgi:hypothetical protein